MNHSGEKMMASIHDSNERRAAGLGFKRKESNGIIDPSLENPFAVFNVIEEGPEIIAVFNPSTPDRSEAVKGLGPSPIPFLLDTYAILGLLRVKRIGIACNTMHYWYNLQREEFPDSLAIPTVHMIEATAEEIERRGIKKVGLLATTGTTNTGLYQGACAKKGIEVVVLRGKENVDAGKLDGKGRMRREAYSGLEDLKREELQGISIDVARAQEHECLSIDFVRALGEQEGLVMESIYGAFGIKAGHTDGIARHLMEEAAKRLVKMGARGLILGCTEVPLVIPGKYFNFRRRTPLFDTTDIVAQRLLEFGRKGEAVGIAGGLGPAATIDMLGKMGMNESSVGFLKEIYNETISQLHGKGKQIVGDRDHLKFVFVQTRDPEKYADALQSLSCLFAAFAPGGLSRKTYGEFVVLKDAREIVRRALEKKAGIARTHVQ